MQKASARVDWLQFTCPATLPLEAVLPLLDGDGVWRVARGAHGYRLGLQRGEVRVYTEGQANMGIHVQLSGRACEQLAAEGLIVDWREYLGSWLEQGARTSRLDLALDDRGGLLSLARIRQAVNRGEAVSRFRESLRTDKQRLTDGRVEGRTVSFGTAQSDAQIRIYDKAAEQGIPGHWVRVELQLRRERAHAGVVAVAEHGPAVIAGLLRGYLNFRRRCQNRQRDRWPLQPWWDRFLGECEAVRLDVPRRGSVSSDSMRWLAVQVSPTLARLAEAQGREGVDTLIEAGMVKLGRRVPAPSLDAGRGGERSETGGCGDGKRY